VQAIAVSQLFEFVNKEGLGDADDFSEDGEKLTLADVWQTVDLAAHRPQVLTDTLRVVNVLTSSAEDALETLSSAFASTYTGLQELGGTSTNTEVVMEAWRLFHELRMRAITLKRASGRDFSLHKWLVFLAVLSSIVYRKFGECLLESADEHVIMF